MQKGVKRNQDGLLVLITKKHYMSLTGHIPQNIVRAGAEMAQRCSISSGKGEKRLKKRGSRYSVRMLRLQSMTISSSLRQMTIAQQLNSFFRSYQARPERSCLFLPWTIG